MRKILRVAFCFALLSGLSLAQDEPNLPGPTKEHEVLKRFVGSWDAKSEAVAKPGEEAVQATGTMQARMLGGLWVVAESAAKMGKLRFQALQTIGYDPKKKKYVGTWVDSMVNHLWTYEGTLSEDGKTLTLESQGPNFMAEGEAMLFRDVYEFKSADHISITSMAQGEEGEWTTFMKGDYRRRNLAR